MSLRRVSVVIWSMLRKRFSGGGRYPSHPVFALCSLTQNKLQVKAKHLGHLYLNGFAHKWHGSATFAFAAVAESPELYP